MNLALAGLVFSTLFVNVAYALPDIIDLDLVEGDEIVVTVEPNPTFENLNFKVVLERKDGEAFDLPGTVWPDLTLDALANLQDLSDEDMAKLQAFALKLQAEFLGGSDLVRLSVRNKDRDIVLKVPFLVADYPYLEQSADKKKLTVTIPVLEENIDDLPSASYLVAVELFNVDGDDIAGDEVFKVTPLFDLDLDFDLNWGGFVLPGQKPMPSDIELSTDTVKPGAEMVVSVTADDGGPINLNDETDWDLDIRRANVAAVINVGSYRNGDMVKEGGGVYTFIADDVEGKYSVVLVNDDGEMVDTANFVVKEGAALGQGGLGLLDGLVDVNDLFQGFDGFAGIGIDVDLGVEQDDDEEVDADFPCSDVEDAFWGRDILKKLIDKNLYPVIRGFVAANVQCRPAEPVTRKEFTAWLLNAYQAEAVADIENVDVSDIPFSDVEQDDPYAPYIMVASQLGIINGHPDGTFKPDAQINRAEVLKILLRSSNLFEATDDEVEDLNDNHADSAPKGKFKDAKDVDAWFYPYLHYGVVNSIIQGYSDGNAKMGQGVLYAEAAKILYLSLKLEGKIN